MSFISVYVCSDRNVLAKTENTHTHSKGRHTLTQNKFGCKQTQTISLSQTNRHTLVGHSTPYHIRVGVRGQSSKVRRWYSRCISLVRRFFFSRSTSFFRKRMCCIMFSGESISMETSRGDGGADTGWSSFSWRILG